MNRRSFLDRIAISEGIAEMDPRSGPNEDEMEDEACPQYWDSELPCTCAERRQRAAG